MRSVLSLLIGLMLVLSLGASATAHVMERPEIGSPTHAGGGIEIAPGHSQGDADQVPADGDKGYPHHHGGCHGDHVATPVKLATALTIVDLRLAPLFMARSVRPLSTADPALRPPRA